MARFEWIVVTLKKVEGSDRGLLEGTILDLLGKTVGNDRRPQTGCSVPWPGLEQGASKLQGRNLMAQADLPGLRIPEVPGSITPFFQSPAVLI
jgi:hypothetical protein